MDAYSGTSDDDLRRRLDDLISRIDSELRIIGPHVSKIGAARQEAAGIVEEMSRRGILPQRDGDKTQV